MKTLVILGALTICSGQLAPQYASPWSPYSSHLNYDESAGYEALSVGSLNVNYQPFNYPLESYNYGNPLISNPYQLPYHNIENPFISGHYIQSQYNPYSSPYDYLQRQETNTTYSIPYGQQLLSPFASPSFGSLNTPFGYNDGYSYNNGYGYGQDPLSVPYGFDPISQYDTLHGYGTSHTAYTNLDVPYGQTLSSPYDYLYGHSLSNPFGYPHVNRFVKPIGFPGIRPQPYSHSYRKPAATTMKPTTTEKSSTSSA
ncbi:hypothetical protein SK128_017266 [Halocaridina rubra]|uniref:Uncharacterized protein n=1 Tax=Halocaridina rubra TaxID=373956 RepID=A0AAN8ZXN8_HALRR